MARAHVRASIKKAEAAMTRADLLWRRGWDFNLLDWLIGFQFTPVGALVHLGPLTLWLGPRS